MMMDALVAVTGTIVVAVAWVFVQLAWRREFPAHGGDPDALAGRTDCHSCEDNHSCQSNGRHTCG